MADGGGKRRNTSVRPRKPPKSFEITLAHLVVRYARMTQPHIVRPDDVVFVSSRVVARFFLLRPDPKMNEAFGYLLGHYAEKYGVVLYAACLMSTHWHLVFRDRFGQRPAFLRDLNRGLANFVKVHRKWKGAVFDNHPNQVRLLTVAAIVDKIAYTLANPVAAGAVRKASEWPGVRASACTSGSVVASHKRPVEYFDPKGSMPNESKLHFALPDALVDTYGETHARELLQTVAQTHESSAHTEIRRDGRSFWGAERCRNVSPKHRATQSELRENVEPTFATKGGGPQVFREAHREVKEFRAAYREALTRWRNGLRNVRFPFGTWLMRVLHKVQCFGSHACSSRPGVGRPFDAL